MAALDLQVLSMKKINEKVAPLLSCQGYLECWVPD